MTILLITLRIRSEPPSGANVSPDRRPFLLSSLASVTLNASTRVDGSDKPVFVPSYLSARPLAISSISLWSALDSESRPTSSKPVARIPASTMSPIVVMLRSRTGRVIIPAWQNRQPRVQPRKISTLLRSCTDSATGTMRLARVRPLVQVHDGVLGDGVRHAWTVRRDPLDPAVGQVLHVVELRHVQLRTGGEPGEQTIAPARPARALPLPDQVGDGQRGLLAVTEHRAVEEIGDRLRVERGMPAREHERIARHRGRPR